MTSFADALRVPSITHETLAALGPVGRGDELRGLAHLLLDQRDTARTLAVTLEQEAHDAQAAVDRVRKLHREVAGFDLDGNVMPTCEDCTDSYPCSTIRALDSNQ